LVSVAPVAASERPKRPKKKAKRAMLKSSKENCPPIFSMIHAENQSKSANVQCCTAKEAPKAKALRSTVAQLSFLPSTASFAYRLPKNSSSTSDLTVRMAVRVSPAIDPMAGSSDDGPPPISPSPKIILVWMVMAAPSTGMMPTAIRATGHMKTAARTMPPTHPNTRSMTCCRGSPVLALSSVESFASRLLTAPTPFSGKSK